MNSELRTQSLLITHSPLLTTKKGRDKSRPYNFQLSIFNFQLETRPKDYPLVLVLLSQ